MMTIMNLVHESKVQRVDKSRVWKTLLKHRWDVEILKTNSCLHEEQISEVIYKTGHNLKLKYDWNLWIPEDDITFGMELYSELYYCHENLIESAKLSKLFESLITKENLNDCKTFTTQTFTTQDVHHPQCKIKRSPPQTFTTPSVKSDIHHPRRSPPPV